MNKYDKEIIGIKKQLNILYGVAWARRKDDEHLWRLVIDAQQIISNYIDWIKKQEKKNE